MSFLETVRSARSHLEEQDRVSLRALKREFELDDDALDGLVEELAPLPHAKRARARSRRSGMPRRAGSSMIFLRGLASLPLRWDAEGAERHAATR